MSRWRRPAFYLAAMAALSIGLGLGVACKKEQSGRGSRGRQAQSQKDKGGGAKRGASKSSRSRGRNRRAASATNVLTYPLLESIKLDVPKGWSRYYVKKPTTGLRASFRLPGVGPDSDDGLVLLEHAPGIKGREQAMIAGWFVQELALPRSIPTAEEMNIREVRAGEITVTMAEMVGPRRRIGAPPSDLPAVRHMVIIAILDHPNGPHVVRAGGPAQSLRRWHKSILTYINSARIAP